MSYRVNRKKLSNDAENNTAVTTAGSNNYVAALRCAWGNSVSYPRRNGVIACVLSVSYNAKTADWSGVYLF